MLSLRFNPCFDGLPFRTTAETAIESTLGCFNPCFDGLPFRTGKYSFTDASSNVSILVLMDYLFGQPPNLGLLCF